MSTTHINREAVERRLSRLRSAYGDVPVLEREETNSTERFDELQSRGEDGYTGGGYAWIVRDPEDAPELSGSMPTDAREEGSHVLLIVDRGDESGNRWSLPGDRPRSPRRDGPRDRSGVAVSDLSGSSRPRGRPRPLLAHALGQFRRDLRGRVGSTPDGRAPRRGVVPDAAADARAVGAVPGGRLVGRRSRRSVVERCRDSRTVNSVDSTGTPGTLEDRRHYFESARSTALATLRAFSASSSETSPSAMASSSSSSSTISTVPSGRRITST